MCVGVCQEYDLHKTIVQYWLSCENDQYEKLKKENQENCPKLHDLYDVQCKHIDISFIS